MGESPRGGTGAPASPSWKEVRDAKTRLRQIARSLVRARGQTRADLESEREAIWKRLVGR